MSTIVELSKRRNRNIINMQQKKKRELKKLNLNLKTALMSIDWFMKKEKRNNKKYLPRNKNSKKQS